MSETPKKRRWLGPALLASLAVNLLIVGIIAGWALTAQKPPKIDRAEREARSLIGMQFVRALDPDDRAALLRGIAGQRGQLRENRDALKGRFEALLAALGDETFDPARIEVLMSEQRQSIADRQKVGERLFIERLTEMTPDERAAYAKRLEKALRHLRRN